MALKDICERGIKSIPDITDEAVLREETRLRIEALENTRNSIKNEFSFSEKNRIHLNALMDKKQEELKKSL